MALHQRTVIRNAIQAAILAAKTSAGDRVYTTRVLPYRADLELPAVAIYTLDEDVDEGSAQRTAPRELERVVPVIIEGWIADPGDGDLVTNIDDDMDAFSLELENAMHADPYLGGAASDSSLAGTELEVVERGDRVLGAIALTYNVKYYTLAPEAPADADLDDFKTVEATYNLENKVDPGDVAVDEFSVEESP